MGRRSGPAGWVIALSGLLALLILAGAVYLLLTEDRTSPAWVLGAAVAMVALGLISVPSAGRTEFAPAYMVAAALPFLTDSVDDMAPFRVFEPRAAWATVGLGLVGLWLLRTLRGDDSRVVLLSLVRRILAFSAYIGGFLAAEWTLDAMGVGIGEWEASILFVFSAAAAFLVEVFSSAVFRFAPGRRASVYFAFETARDLPIYISLVATGALFGLAFGTIGWGALVLAALPYAFAHSAFRRFEQAKTTYRQTIQALAQIPEVGGHTDPGHARRTADLSVAIATDMGLRPGEVEFTEYAAYLHDIGRVSLNEPSVLRMGFTENDIARWGAEIVGETAYLSDVADVVGRQYEPFRTPGDGGDPDLPVAAKIVKVASAYDESSVELGFTPLEAMDRLHRGAAYDYDPEIVAVLRRILDRRGVFHPLGAAG